MSDTPIVDAAWKEAQRAATYTEERRAGWDVARKLERELAAYKRMLGETMDVIKRWQDRQP